MSMDLGVAVLADGLKVRQVPSVEVEVCLADADLERADDVVDLVARGDPAFLEAFLAQTSVALQHGVADGPPP